MSTVRAVSTFPWPMLAQGVLVAAALYVPTTLVDHDADARAGFRTLSTRLGPRRASLIGWWCWCAANLGAILLCATNTVIPRDLIPLVGVATPCLVAEYAALITWPRTGLPVVRGIVITSATFFAVNVAFAIEYTRH
jgi:4-hydroxybenzoate polyprenyltransferase